MAGFTEEDEIELAKVDLSVWMDDMKKTPRHKLPERTFIASSCFGLKAAQARDQYALAVRVDDRPLNACAQDSFTHFLSVAACMINEFGGTTTHSWDIRTFVSQ